MNKHLLFAVVGVLALIGLGSCGLAKADEPSTNLVEQVFEPSVQLGNFCSGEIIHSDRDKESGKVSTIVLTAKHCVMDDTNQIVQVNNSIEPLLILLPVLLDQVCSRW